MYRDYFETDIEEDPEDTWQEIEQDKEQLALGGEFNPDRFDFIETNLDMEVHENFEDLVEDKIFKYKYRRNADPEMTFARREARRISRFMERLEHRDPAIEVNVADAARRGGLAMSFAQLGLDHKGFKNVTMEETRPLREYMV